MMKKTPIFLFLIGIFTAAFVLSGAYQGQTIHLASKASHAEELWQHSGHADSTAEAFRHWDEDGEIPTSCAKCHSTPGFVDFITDGSVDSAVSPGTTVECTVCHVNPEQGVLRNHTSVVFPSGVKVEKLGSEALCMECHQGRASTASVDAAIERAGVDDDTPSPSLRFINIHYYAAAANQLGTVAKGGYEYAGKGYDARFSHIKGYNACITCHNPHSLEVDLEACHTCHTGVNDPKDIRFYGSFVDYDGDGDTTEGIYYEIETMKDKLYAAIQAYANEVIGAPIVYDSHTYPYFFHDNNRNGQPDPDEANYGNRYTSFSPRLLRAAYNYQVAQKDPAGFAHGGKYIIELLYDSLEDLNSKLNNPVSMAGMSRVDEGHFNGSSEAFRHWDEDGEVSAFCSKCHSAEGLPHLLETGETGTAEVSNGFLCTTCHTSPPGVRRVDQVKFPSGEVKDLGDSSNLCMMCHQGRASLYSVQQAIASSSGPYYFINVHYYPAAAVLFGSEVHGGFEYPGKVYSGQQIFPNHMGKFDTCVECHMGTKSDLKPYDYTGQMHSVAKPDPRDCVNCHGQDISQPNPGSDPAKFKFSGIRPASIPDFDGDGNRSESIKDEILGLEEQLLDLIKKYARDKLGAPIIYDSHSYPYFFFDSNGNGAIDPGENIYPNRYLFDARLLKAAYNYQLSHKEPHGFIHNARYIAELLVDSIVSLGGDPANYPWR